ncbi:MAG TPA: RNA polymerase subunit sigma-70 [Ruminococcaceae bacterium]|nr:RNA polymerase subunit sigma-70 [Oscillospiraceae bacterium]
MSGKDAFPYAFSQFTDTVYRVAVHNSARTADAEDITQSVFVKLLESEKAFRGTEHLKAWLIRVTINLCRDELRKNANIVLCEAPLPKNAAEKEDSVIEAVRALPENYRNAVYLHYYEGYSAKEIGKILDAKPNTVLSWLSRGRAMLKEEMIGGFDDE